MKKKRRETMNTKILTNTTGKLTIIDDKLHTVHPYKMEHGHNLHTDTH